MPRFGIAALAAVLLLTAVFSGCSAEGTEFEIYDFSGFSFRGFTLGGDINALNLSDMSEIEPLAVKNSYKYNYDNVNYGKADYDRIRFDTDENGRITRFFLEWYGNGSTTEQIEQSLGGKGKTGWQDREQRLRYEEYADNGGNKVRFVYVDATHELVWVIAEVQK